jgi:class 3 adenylate cyclase
VTGERRLVTVLFADISGFTAMLERLDPEDARSLINGCFDQLVPVIQKYGGTVDKFIGDEIMALFGAPMAHEDDAERALRAALEMMEVLAEFNHLHNSSMDVHIGVNTGLVFAGAIGSQGRQSYTVMGDAVNLASRLEELSEAGEILVGPDTHRLVAPLFEFASLEPVTVKGKSEPVHVYKLLGLSMRPGQLRGLTGLESPMVGREVELQRLLQLSEGPDAQRGHVVLIVGEPGLGKSRLVAEWRTALQSSEGELWRWVEGRCLSYGQGLAYHLLVDLLHEAVGVPAAAGEAETRQALSDLCQDLFADAALEVYPYLGHLLSIRLPEGTRERVQQLDPQTLQGQYLAALRRLFLTLSQHGPLLLVLEDIHWADPSSVELLIKLLPLIEQAPVLFCYVTRPNYDAPGWKLAEASREQMEPYLTELVLQVLSEEESRRLISNLLEIEALPEEVRQIILHKAEGNPFFVEEVIRMLIDREAIVREAGRWAAREGIEEIEIPDNLQSLLLARIDRLPDDVKRTLRVASVIGRQFSVKVLAEVLRRAGI